MNEFTASVSSFLAKFTTPLIIFLFSISFVCLWISFICAKVVDRDIDKYSEKKFKSNQYKLIEGSYTIFYSFASVLPLLGMLGTVVSLLNIDLGGDLETVKGNFFIALDTTMWGLCGSIILKILNAFLQPKIEMAQEKLAELMKKTYF